MERQGSRFPAIPPRTLAIVVGSAITIGVASLVFLWPTVRGLFPAAVHQSPTPTAYATYEVVAESPNDAYVVRRPPGAGLSSASMFRTQDAGTSWHPIALPPLALENGFLVTRLQDGNLLLRAFNIDNTAQTFYLVNGNTWAEIALPVPDAGSGTLDMIDSRLGFYVVFGPELSVYRTQDGGHRWEQRLHLNGAHPSGGGLQLADDFTFFTFSDAAHGWLVAIPPSWGIVCGHLSQSASGQRLMQSQDGGANWTAVSLPNPPEGSNQLGIPVFPSSVAAGYLTITAYTYVGKCPPVGITYAYGTLDDGATWTGPRRVPAPFFNSADGIVWWAFDGKQLFRSGDQGRTWQMSKPKLPPAAGTLQGLFVVNTQAAWSLWSGGHGQPPSQALLRTIDSGAHWSEIKLPG